MAWVNKTEPPKGKVGFDYMLQGGTTPSNVDNKHLVGIVSVGDLATTAGGTDTGEALSGISQPGGQHSQTT